MPSSSFAGHILLPALLAAPCEARRAELLHATQVLRSGHLREAGTSLLSAFQWGHYSKVRLRGSAPKLEGGWKQSLQDV